MSFPLYDELLQLNAEVEQRWPGSYGLMESIHLGVGPIDFTASAPRTKPYHCTPGRARTFAGTGGGSVHFSFISTDNIVTESSPVVVTTPSMEGATHAIGQDLFEFLRWGCLRGFLGMQFIKQQRYQFAFGDTEWYAGKDALGEVGDRDRDCACGFGFDETASEVLEFLRTELGLTPIENPVGRFEILQEQFGAIVRPRQRPGPDLRRALRRWFTNLWSG